MEPPAFVSVAPVATADPPDVLRQSASDMDVSTKRAAESFEYQLEAEGDGEGGARLSGVSTIVSTSVSTPAVDGRNRLGDAIAKSWQFELCVWIVIVLNCIAVWIETSFSHRDQTVNKWPWIGIQFACLLFFVAELIFKMVALSWRFFKDVYNWIDLMIVVMTILPWYISMWMPALGWTSNAEMAWRKLSILRIIRGLRISRAFRYHPVFREFWMLTGGITYSLKTLVWSVIITAIMLFVYGTFVTTMIGFSSDFQPEQDPSTNQIAEQCRNLTSNLTDADAAELQDRFGIIIPLLQQQCEAFVEKGRRALMGLDGLWPSPRLLSDEDGEPFITNEEKEEVQSQFGTVVRSMRTLFQIMTLDDWTDATEVVVKQQPWMWLCFVGFICISVFAPSNLITAVLVESATQMSREDEKRREFENHREIWKLRCMLIRVMNAGVRPDSENGSGDRRNERTAMAQRGTIGSLTTAAEEEEAKASTSDPKDPSPTHGRTNGMAGGAPSPKGVRGIFFKSLTSLVDRSCNTPKGKRRMSCSDVYQDVQLSEMNDSFTKSRLAEVMGKAELKRLMKMYECEPNDLLYECEPNDLLGLCDQLTVDFETRDPTGRRKEGEIKMDDFIFGVQRLKGGAKSKDLLHVLTRLSMIERNQEHIMRNQGHIMKVLNAVRQGQLARPSESSEHQSGAQGDGDGGARLSDVSTTVSTSVPAQAVDGRAALGDGDAWAEERSLWGFLVLRIGCVTLWLTDYPLRHFLLIIGLVVTYALWWWWGCFSVLLVILGYEGSLFVDDPLLAIVIFAPPPLMLLVGLGSLCAPPFWFTLSWVCTASMPRDLRFGLRFGALAWLAGAILLQFTLFIVISEPRLIRASTSPTGGRETDVDYNRLSCCGHRAGWRPSPTAERIAKARQTEPFLYRSVTKRWLKRMYFLTFVRLSKLLAVGGMAVDLITDLAVGVEFTSGIPISSLAESICGFPDAPWSDADEECMTTAKSRLEREYLGYQAVGFIILHLSLADVVSLFVHYGIRGCPSLCQHFCIAAFALLEVPILVLTIVWAPEAVNPILFIVSAFFTLVTVLSRVGSFAWRIYERLKGRDDPEPCS